MSELNQQYIANALGLSRATVSRCFTNHKGINPKTRAKVFELASQIGYQHLESRTPKKNEIAKAIDIAIFVGSDRDTIYSDDFESPGKLLLEGVSEFTQINNIHMDIHYVNTEEKSILDPSYKKIKKLHRKRNWQGALFIYPFPDEILKELTPRFPCVSIVEQFGATSINVVDVDHYQGISDIVNYLTSKGHHKIGFFTYDAEIKSVWSFRRYSSFIEKMSRLNITVPLDNIINVHPDRRFGEKETLQTALDRTRSGEVTAWVCANDYEAYSLIGFLQSNNVSVPEDVSITGFDGTKSGRHPVNLCTIKIPFHDIGMAAGKHVLQLIEKRFVASHKINLSGVLQEGSTVKTIR